MRDVTIARNYSETLFELASRASATTEWGDLLDAAAAAMSTPSIEAALMTPRVPREQKVAIVSQALRDAPRPFSLFVVAVVRRGRQYLMSSIADEYRDMLDIKLGRVRAGITLAREIDPAMRDELVKRLSAAIGKDVITAFVTDPALIGGAMVRIGDRVYDGSVRKRLGRLRQQLLK